MSTLTLPSRSSSGRPTAPVNDAPVPEPAPLVAGDLASAVCGVLRRLAVQDEGMTSAVPALAEELA